MEDIITCAVCLDTVRHDDRFAMAVTCKNSHFLHNECFRGLIRNHQFELLCPTCREPFECMLCEGGWGDTNIICSPCILVIRSLQYQHVIGKILAAEPHTKTKVKHRRFSVLTILCQHIVFFFLFGAVWRGVGAGIVSSSSSVTKVHQLANNVIIFFNFHLNVWLCCDRVLEASIVDVLKNNIHHRAAQREGRGGQERYLAKMNRIMLAHHNSKRCIAVFALLRLVCFAFDAVGLLSLRFAL
jgi:hypothetical protein